ncbi:MAG: hypothetical protein P0Y49_20790 [Candidatus Pedobacter colombiensis]|uniref:YXWGXW repeat-containing protein n=1 Tax=Candidatus Pedobacter colombiensis TaxID=3121371 RepID=A0AAJ6B5X1_9SPHI|nr:DUF6600 domain-containing protein [Pedobacter sp.]WEK19217.1 MAG: hypothetical protein P0Y49_20790 [Pedobacter sp.]
MKNMIKLPAIVLGLMLMLTGTTQKVMAQGEDVSLQSFYDDLSPYGTWIQDPQYGYVWRPDVEQQGDFRPYYTNGRWVMTEYGNTWVSNYDWGWAPFHYGRWVYNRYGQWIWIPDTVWGPAWVSWRSGDGYYGWAPMGPGIDISFSIPALWWVFIPQRNIYGSSFPRYYSNRNTVYINNTTIINNTYVRNRRTYYTGPRADDIRRATRQDVRVYNLNNTGRPSRTNISGNSLNIYTPRPSRGNNNANARPKQAIQQEGATVIRGTRNPGGNGAPATGRPSRGENQGNTNRPGVTPPTGTTRPGQGNNTRPGRPEMPHNPGTTQPQRPQVERPVRQEQAPVQQPQPQPQPRPQVTHPQRPQQPQRQESRPAPQPQQQRPEAPRPQRQEQPQRQESRPAPQPQQQRPEAPRPQRQEQPQPQQQRPERVQPQQQPQRSNDGRGNQGGGERPTRTGRE